jgi:hypothetical protein
MDATRVGDWDELRRLITESYRLIAPKRPLTKLFGEMTPPKAAARRTAAKPKAAGGRKPAAKPARRKRPA